MLRRVGIVLGLLFLTLQSLTLVGPPALVTAIAYRDSAPLSQQIPVAVGTSFEGWAEIRDVTPRTVAIRWWTAFVEICALATVGVFALAQPARAFGPFALALIAVSAAEFVTTSISGIGFFWFLEAGLVAFVLLAFWFIDRARQT